MQEKPRRIRLASVFNEHKLLYASTMWQCKNSYAGNAVISGLFYAIFQTGHVTYFVCMPLIATQRQLDLLP